MSSSLYDFDCMYFCVQSYAFFSIYRFISFRIIKCSMGYSIAYYTKKVRKNLSLRSLCTFLYHFSITSQLLPPDLKRGGRSLLWDIARRP